MRENAEKAIGVRCECGKPITDGWEWVTIGTALGPDRELQQIAGIVRTCGTGCMPEKSLEISSQTVCRRKIKIEWDWPNRPPQIVDA